MERNRMPYQAPSGAQPRYRGGQNPAEPDDRRPEPEGDDGAGFEELVSEFSELIRAGKIPEDLDIGEACGDPEFVELTMEFPMEAAIRIYAAERKSREAETGAKRRVESDLMKRRALPKSQRANLSVSPSPDYKHMSGEEFRKLEQQYKRAAMAGKRVNL